MGKLGVILQWNDHKDPCHQEPLTRKDYETLAAMPTVTGARWLIWNRSPPMKSSSPDWMRALCTGASCVEQILTYSVYADFQKIYRFSTVQQRAFMDLYFGRYEIAIMKRSLPDAFRSPECFHGPDDLYRLFQPPFRFGSEQTFRQPDH